jgi:hypothetical protein
MGNGKAYMVSNWDEWDEWDGWHDVGYDTGV